MRAGTGLDELAGNADLAARLSDTAFQHVADTQLSSNLLDVDSLALVGEARIARDDKQRFEARERSDDVLDHPVREVFLLGIARHVLEWQHRDGRLIGKWQWLFGVRGRTGYNGRSRSTMIPRFCCIDSHGAVDVFQLPLAEVVECKIGLAPHLLEGTAGQADPTRHALVLDACRDVDAIAADVLLVNYAIADIDTDTKDHVGAAAFRIPADHLLLNGHRTGDCIHRAGELDQHPVAGSLDDTTVMRGDHRIDQFASVRFQRLQGSNLVGAHQTTVASNVG